MITYVLIYSVLALFGYALTKKNNQIFLTFISVLFLLFFAGTRYNTGCDFWGYLQRFNNLDPFANPLTALSFEEPGFQFVIQSVVYFDLGYMWLNIACTILILPCVYLFSKLSKDPLLLLALLFPILIVQLSMSGLRQAVATAFLMLAFVAFVKNNRLAIFAWILIGATFHQSVLIFMPLVLISGKEVKVKRIVYSLLVLGPLAALMLSDRMSVYSDRYIEQIYGESTSSGAILRLLLLLLPSILFEFKKAKFKESFPSLFPLVRLFSLITIALIPVALISTVAVHRLGYYVLPVQMLTFSLLPYVYAQSYSNVMKVRLIPITVLGLYITTWFSISKHASVCYVPYESYLL